jgi:hypothetical protein
MERLLMDFQKVETLLGLRMVVDKIVKFLSSVLVTNNMGSG